MGQKINPHGFRLGSFYTWNSRWFATKQTYRDNLLNDVNLRGVLMARLKTAGIARVEIERLINKIEIILYVSRPGVVIGRGGQGLEELKKFIADFLKIKDGKNSLKIDLKIEPVKEPNLEAYLVAQNISDQLIRRLPHNRVANQTIERVMGAGAKGVRVVLSGRIGGSEIGRRERYQQGEVPLTTLREKIDMASVPALTKSGYIGVKVWICQP